MSVEHDDDIEASRAPLMDHLVELRSRLIICVVSIVVGFIICFGFAEPIYRFLLHPFQMAAQMYAASKSGQPTGPFDLLFVLIGIKDAPPATGVDCISPHFSENRGAGGAGGAPPAPPPPCCAASIRIMRSMSKCG